jgi:hypothetical protein
MDESDVDYVFLSVVEAAFDIGERGCVIVPGISLAAVPPDVRVDDLLRLERPDGTVLEARVKGIESVRSANNQIIPLLLSPLITKADVPVGTKVIWLGSSRS